MTKAQQKNILWSHIHLRRYNWLYNMLKKEDKLKGTYETYIKEMKKELPDYIKNINLSGSSKEALLFMVARWLEINERNPSKLLTNIKNEAYEQKIKNEMTEGQNLKSANEEENIKPLKYYEDILTKGNINEARELEHFKYLLLAMLIYGTPLRSSFYVKAKIITDIKDATGENNFILLDTQNKDIYFIINNDKVSKRKGGDIIKMNSKELYKILYNSFCRFPRVYLFDNKGDVITSPNTLLNWLRSITGHNTITINNFRSMYINEQYKNKNMTYNEKLELARSMRHSVSTAERNYIKI